jgi:replication factor C subunit 2/4
MCLQDAQNALRRIMETHSATTRFCFICNYVSRIIEPLASRCAKFRFKPLHEEVMEARVKHICKCEGVELADGSLETLGRISRGDLRRAITSLQSAFALQGNPVTSATLLDVAGEVWPPLSGSFAQPLNA